MKRFIFLLAVLATLLGMAGQVRSEVIYWTQNNNSTAGGDIHRANLDGSDQTILVRGLDGPRGINLDPNSGKMYWADANPTPTGIGDIRRANLDGTGAKTLFSVTTAVNVVLDQPDGKLYFTDYGDNGVGGEIGRANLDGTGRMTLINNIAASGIALDQAGGTFYWTNNPNNNAGSGSIRRASLVGTGATTLVTGATTPNGIAVDPTGGKMYWAQFLGGTSGTGAIHRANLDGSGQETIASNLPGPLQIALDLPTGKVYWTDLGTPTSTGSVPGTGDIRRANLDGSDQEIVISGLTQPIGVALAVPEPSGLVLIAIAGCGFLRRRSRRHSA